MLSDAYVCYVHGQRFHHGCDGTSEDLRTSTSFYASAVHLFAVQDSNLDLCGFMRKYNQIIRNTTYVWSEFQFGFAVIDGTPAVSFLILTATPRDKNLSIYHIHLGFPKFVFVCWLQRFHNLAFRIVHKSDM